MNLLYDFWRERPKDVPFWAWFKRVLLSGLCYAVAGALIWTLFDLLMLDIR